MKTVYFLSALFLLGTNACERKAPEPAPTLQGVWMGVYFTSDMYQSPSQAPNPGTRKDFPAGTTDEFTQTAWIRLSPGSQSRTYAYTRNGNFLHSLHGAANGREAKWTIEQLTARELVLSKTDTSNLMANTYITLTFHYRR